MLKEIKELNESKVTQDTDISLKIIQKNLGIFADIFT